MEHILYQAVLVFWLFLGCVGAIATAHERFFVALIWIIAIIAMFLFFLRLGV